MVLGNCRDKIYIALIQTCSKELCIMGYITVATFFPPPDSKYEISQEPYIW